MKLVSGSYSRAELESLHDFSPSILAINNAPPSPLPRLVLRYVLLLIVIMIVWGLLGRLDIVAIAEGKLVPISYLKIVQPAEAGIIREIVVSEGEIVKTGQVLVRMDTSVYQADSKAIQGEIQHKSLELSRIEAELTGHPFTNPQNDSSEFYKHVNAKYAANRQAFENAISLELANLDKAKQDLASVLEIQYKLEKTLPSLLTQEQAYVKLGQEGFVAKLMVLEKQRDRIEKEQDLRAQKFNANGLKAAIVESEEHLAQIRSEYKQKLHGEKVALYADLEKLKQEWAKQTHRNSLLELRASQSGIVKDIATHTPGTVVSPGTVLMTLIPNNEALLAEVWTKNDDAGFVRPEQLVKLKLGSFPFQKYGMIEGKVSHVSADASDGNHLKSLESSESPDSSRRREASSYRTLVTLQTQTLDTSVQKFQLSPGMQVTAEIKLGDQSVFEYLLSPVRRAFHEAGRER